MSGHFHKVLMLACVLPLRSFGCELAELGFLAADDAVHHEFTQTKTVAALARPLVSAGVLGISSAGELIWQTQRPLKATLVITAESLRQYDRRDELVSELAIPVVQAFARLLLSVFRGDLAALDNTFRQTLACTDVTWELTLVPTGGEFALLVRSVTLGGSLGGALGGTPGEETTAAADTVPARLQRIAFEEVRGDRTEILLSAPIARPLDNAGLYAGD